MENNGISIEHYIDNQLVKFEREEILDTITLYLPTLFGVMPNRLENILYPSTYRPALLLTTKNVNVNLGFNIINHYKKDNFLEDLVNKIRLSMEQEKHIYSSEVKRIDKMNGYYFSFQCSVRNENQYNMQLFLPLKTSYVHISFNCPSQQKQDWKPVVLFVCESIEIMNDKHKGFYL